MHLEGEVETEASDLERHPLGFAQGGFWLGPGHSQLIAPRVDLNASAERQRNDRIGRWLRIGLLRGGHCGSDGPACRDSVAKMWTDKIGDVFRTLLERFEEKLGCLWFLVVRRVSQQFVGLLLGGPFLRGSVSKCKVAEGVSFF